MASHSDREDYLAQGTSAPLLNGSLASAPEHSGLDTAGGPTGLKRVLMLGLVMWVLFVISGPITGPQAIFGSLARRGVFKSKCDGLAANSTEWHMDGSCTDQEQAIESGADLCLSICNFLCVLWGFAQDTIGPRRVAFFGIVLWTIAKSCAGIAPSSGIVWVACESIAASASLGAFSALGLEHLRQACGSESLYAVMGFIASAAWDIAVLLNLALAELYSWSAITLWQAYLIYGAGAGVPVLVGLAMWPKKPEESAQAKDAAEPFAGSGSDPSMSTIDPMSPTATKEADVAEADNDNARLNGTDGSAFAGKEEEKGGKGAAQLAVVQALGDIKGILSTGSFWLFAAHSTAIVTVGYFMISNVGSLAHSHGYSDGQKAREVTTYLMSASGLTSVIPGQLLSRLGTKKGLLALLGLELALILATAICMTVGHLTLFYVAFGLMFMWRVWGFGLSFPFIAWRFSKQYPNGVGVCYGGTYALAGAVSMGAGAGAGSALHANPKEALIPVMWGFCGIALLIQLAFAVAVLRIKDESAESVTLGDGGAEDAPSEVSSADRA